MKKNKLKIYLPILALVIIGILLFLIIKPEPITEKTYFRALANVNCTKQVQVVEMHESGVLLYQKTEVIIFGGNAIKHEITQKTIDFNGDEDYIIEVQTYYYSNGKMYYQENGEWKNCDFNINDNLYRYHFDASQFNEFTFDEEITNDNSFNGKLKNESVKSAINLDNASNVSVTIKINNNLNLQNFSYSATLSSGRSYSLVSNYTYNQENVTMPEFN